MFAKNPPLKSDRKKTKLSHLFEQCCFVVIVHAQVAIVNHQIVELLHKLVVFLSFNPEVLLRFHFMLSQLRQLADCTAQLIPLTDDFIDVLFVL